MTNATRPRDAAGPPAAGRRRRVVHVLNTAALGGGAKQVGSLIEGMPELDSILVCFESGPLVERLQEHGVRCEVLRLGPSRLPGPGLRRLARLLRGLEPEIVHCHGTRAAFFVACLRPRLRGVHLVYTERGLAYQRHAPLGRRVWGRSVETWNGRVFERTVCVSRGDQDWALASRLFLPGRTRCILDGIDPAEAHASSGPEARAATRRLLGVPEKAELVLTIGRLEIEKGPDDLIDAFALVRARRPEAHLAWIGAGRLEARARERARDLGVADRCHFAGARANAAAFLPACDVFALASLWEGLPSVLLEALLAERPCAATAVNGVPEILQDGVTGRTSPARDARALGTVIVELLAQADWARELARAGAAHVRTHFRMEDTLAGYRSLYDELLSNRLRKTTRSSPSA